MSSTVTDLLSAAKVKNEQMNLDTKKEMKCCLMNIVFFNFYCAALYVTHEDTWKYLIILQLLLSIFASVIYFQLKSLTTHSKNIEEDIKFQESYNS